MAADVRRIWEEGAGTDGVGSDGVGTDGVGADRVGSEGGVGSDGVGSDGVGTDSVGTDGVGTDGVGTDGVGSDGVGSDGVGTDGVGTDGAGSDGVGADAGVGSDGAGSDSVGTTGLAAVAEKQTEQGEQEYMDRLMPWSCVAHAELGGCAMQNPSGQAPALTGYGTPYEMYFSEGAVGLENPENTYLCCDERKIKLFGGEAGVCSLPTTEKASKLLAVMREQLGGSICGRCRRMIPVP